VFSTVLLVSETRRRASVTVTSFVIIDKCFSELVLLNGVLSVYSFDICWKFFTLVVAL